MTSRVLLVDDERLARVALRQLLTSYPQLEVVGEADGVDAAAHLIARLQPDLIFLDVHMPPDSGFDLFERVEMTARVVFVTAFDSYALRAFEVNALDYLLKPVAPRRLDEAIARLCATGGALDPQLDPAAGTPPVDRPLAYDDRVCVPTERGARLFFVHEIDVVRASDDYAELHLRNGTSLLSNRTLAAWEKRLPAQFIRVHRSAVVNMERVQDIVRMTSDAYALRISGHATVIPVRRRLGPMLLERFRRALG